MSNKQTHPLAGFTILNTRPSNAAQPLTDAIETLGGKCLNLPSFEISPLTVRNTEFQSKAQQCDYWFFMSQYAVNYAVPLIKQCHLDLPPYIAAVGKTTAQTLKVHHLPVHIIPEKASSEGLLALNNICAKNKKVTFFRGKAGRTLLDDILRKQGATVNEIQLYERIPAVWTDAVYEPIAQSKIDLILGMSVDSLRYLFNNLQAAEKKRFQDIPWLLMSRRVAKEARILGIKSFYIVNDSDILKSLVQWVLYS